MNKRPHPPTLGERISRWFSDNHNELTVALWSTVSFYDMGTPLSGNATLLFLPLLLGAIYFPLAMRKKPVIARVDTWMSASVFLLCLSILASYLFNAEDYDLVFMGGNVGSAVLLFIALYTIAWKMELNFQKLLVFQCIIALPVFPIVLHNSVMQWGRVVPADARISPNYVAMMGLVCAIAAFGVRSRIGMILLGALPVYIMVVMQSRDSILCCAIAAAIIFWYRLRQLESRKIQIYAALLFLLGPVVFVGLDLVGIDLFKVAQDLFDRVTLVNDDYRGVDSGGSGRTDLWKAAIDRWTEHPIFGLGFKGQAMKLPDNLLAHNSYLGTMVETGTVGLIAYLMIVYVGLYHIIKRGNSRLNSYPQRLAVFISYLIYGMMESRGFGFGNTYTLLFLLMAFDSSKQPVSRPVRVNPLKVPMAATAPSPSTVATARA